MGLELSAVAARLLADHGGTAAARATLDGAPEELPPFWPRIIELGWLGLHIDEEYGGQGAGLPEVGAVVEQMGASLAPGPFLPTVLASAVISVAGNDAQRKALLPRLTSGTAAAVATGPSLRHNRGTVNGEAGPVLGAGLADILLLPTDDDLVVVERHAAGVTIAPQESFDSSRRFATVTCSAVDVADEAVLPGGVTIARRIGRALAAAEAAGLARACTDAAVAYAKVREQFGRTIGTFQAVKHMCADMLVGALIQFLLCPGTDVDAHRTGRDARLVSTEPTEHRAHH